MENLAEDRIEPVSGDDLYLSLDYNIQCYVQQAAKKVLKAKKAKRVSAILMNPQNGEIYALVSLPEYDLNEQFTLIEEYKEQGKTQNDKLNNMWRNPVISDSYEPGSTFKIVTATAALEEKKAKDIKILDISGVSVLADYFIIASGSNRNQVQAMADEAQEKLYKAGYEAKQVEGYQTANWILMDYQDIIVHIFDEENRLFYDLERIWRDGSLVEKADLEA